MGSLPGSDAEGPLRNASLTVSDAARSNAKNGFPKSRRLLRHSEFERVYRHGRRHFAVHLTVFYLLRERGLSGLRIGFTVGKGLGGAVQRNRIKRRLREAVRLSGFPAAVAADLVINPKPSVLKVEFAELQKEVTKALEVIEKSFEKGKSQP
jgi:ribonuclease P protein component